MNNKFLLRVLIVFLFFMLFSNAFIFAKEKYNPLMTNEGSKYEFYREDMPEVFFFPEDKARWNGYEVTLRDWKRLVDYQRIKFVEEALNIMMFEGKVIDDYSNSIGQIVITMDNIVHLFLLGGKKYSVLEVFNMTLKEYYKAAVEEVNILD